SSVPRVDLGGGKTSAKNKIHREHQVPRRPGAGERMIGHGEDRLLIQFDVEMCIAVGCETFHSGVQHQMVLAVVSIRNWVHYVIEVDVPDVILCRYVARCPFPHGNWVTQLTGAKDRVVD